MPGCKLEGELLRLWRRAGAALTQHWRQLYRDKSPWGFDLVPLLQDVPMIIKNCKAPGPLYLSALSQGELRHLNNMMGRLYQLAEAATAVRAPPLSVILQLHRIPAWLASLG